MGLGSEEMEENGGADKFLDGVGNRWEPASQTVISGNKNDKKRRKTMGTKRCPK